MKKLLALLALIIIPITAIAADHLTAMKQVKFNQTSYQVIKVAGRDISIRYSGMGNNVSAQDMVSHIRRSTDEVMRTLKSRGINVEPCKQLDLDVYELDYLTINNGSIMNFIELGKGTKIDGLYDSIYSPAGRASIFIASDLVSAVRVETISHEVAHYWHDMMCLKRVGIESEDLAESVQASYLRNQKL